MIRRFGNKGLKNHESVSEVHEYELEKNVSPATNSLQERGNTVFSLDLYEFQSLDDEFACVKAYNNDNFSIDADDESMDENPVMVFSSVALEIAGNENEEIIHKYVDFDDYDVSFKTWEDDSVKPDDSSATLMLQTDDDDKDVLQGSFACTDDYDTSLKFLVDDSAKLNATDGYILFNKLDDIPESLRKEDNTMYLEFLDNEFLTVEDEL
ncbi:OLC1v1012805C1 [Oldenlandia corymbosa var. corymbosa]|uniref:OLC1v1012805C1 n=1 Tax=Oldenlandia corymbosa var. corymbosa TaxID=529605 RepID=A0AAV1DZT3_OLDCO|nr:OLC1v1012805C1 [Oldenlandia corymbosa var. corymbosa]